MRSRSALGSQEALKKGTHPSRERALLCADGLRGFWLCWRRGPGRGVNVHGMLVVADGRLLELVADALHAELAEARPYRGLLVLELLDEG